MQISVSTAAVRRAKLGVFLAKRCFGTTSTAAVPGVADQNSTRETTGQSPTRSPQFDFPARDKHPGRPEYRAYTARRPQGERARRIRPAPHTRKKTRGRRWLRDAFYQPSARARRAIPTLFFSPTPLDGITGMFSRVCAVRVSLVRVLAARGARSRDRPPSRFPTPRGELFGKRLVGFFREIPGDGRAGCSTRARAHFDPGFFRMKPPWVLRTTVRFLAYYTRHSRVRCGANDHPLTSPSHPRSPPPPLSGEHPRKKPRGG